MKRFIRPFLFIGILLLIVVLISWFAFPGWRSTQGGIFALIGTAIVGVVSLVKDLITIINEIKKAGKSRSAVKKPLTQTQVMIRSEDGEQYQKGGKANQSQKMDESPRGKQRQE